MENKCSSSCECECCKSGSCNKEGSSCSSKPAASSCPVEKATEMWTSAFCQAMKEVHVDILKAKIQKAWGAKLDKSADAVLEAMEVQWSSMLAQGKAKMDLKQKIAQAMMEGKK